MAEPKVTMYGERFPPKAITESVEVFQTIQPKRDYVEIARIECGDTDDTYNMEQLLLKAKEIGADGLIIIGRSGTLGMAVPIGNLAFGVGEGYGMAAIAIKYR
ncbi:MAG: hypothetical protein E8D47_12205 [Nitrospira sp.]|nr:MAG: hypothetical protein E8D47_12205 [Nitrospira sp.]